MYSTPAHTHLRASLSELLAAHQSHPSSSSQISSVQITGLVSLHLFTPTSSPLATHAWPLSCLMAAISAVMPSLAKLAFASSRALGADGLGDLQGLHDQRTDCARSLRTKGTDCHDRHVPPPSNSEQKKTRSLESRHSSGLDARVDHRCRCRVPHPVDGDPPRESTDVAS